MRNNKPIPRHKLRKGMRIKMPWNGNWWGSNKKYVWLKGTIIELGYNHAIVSLRKSHGINRCLCCGSNLDYIYKQL